MKKIKITDATQGQIYVSKSKGKYFKTKDSTSKSGHSILAQIDMTHAGIVTRNYGFYLPNRMKSGANTFTKDYAKPLLIGHDDDTQPVGRVIQAEYIDTSNQYKIEDQYVRSLFNMTDKKNKTENIASVVRHIIQTYDRRDDYKGLGHIRGTVKITDSETIEKVLNGTLLTVSTAMVSDSAVCSICGTDWVKDGMCEHNRGQIYDDNVCVVIPGSMAYEHLAIVNTPADPHAHDFYIISDGVEKEIKLEKNEDMYKISDHYDLAAQLFAYSDSNIISLSSETDVNFIDIKDNIQKMENAMKLEGINSRIKDALDIKVEIYRYATEDMPSREVTVREYVGELNEEELQKMISQITTLISSDGTEISDEDINVAIDKYCAENFEAVDAKQVVKEEDKEEKETDSKEEEEDKKEESEAEEKEEDKKKCKKKAKKMSDNFRLEVSEEIENDFFDEVLNEFSVINEEREEKYSDKIIKKAAEYYSLLKKEDALAIVIFGKDSTAENVIEKLQELDQAQKLAEINAEDFYELMKKHMKEDEALTEDQLKELKATNYCGKKGFFPVVDKAHYVAAKKVLAEISAADSVKERILVAIEKRAKKLELDLTDNFDNEEETCNNNDNIKVDELLKQFEDARSKLEEFGIQIPETETKDSFVEKDQEIEILEAQLEAANEEIDALTVENKELRDNLSLELATRTVDTKMLSGNFEINDRVAEIENLAKRSLDSLKDGLKDLENNFKIQDFLQQDDGIEKAPTEDVDDPTLKHKDEKAGNSSTEQNAEEEKFKLYDEYNKRVATYGKFEADRWLSRIQRKNGSVQTID